MKSFEAGVLERQMVPASLLATSRLLGEYRVRQHAFADRLTRARTGPGVPDRASSARASVPTIKQVLQLHADLYRFVPERGGHWKLSDDLVTEAQADGSTSVVFTPVPAYAVEDAMVRLHEGFTRYSAADVIDPLLLVASYLLDFQCIHPFSDGNNEMVRLLTLVLLEWAGYRVAAFVPLDGMFRETRSAWTTALHASWRGWHQSKHTLAPWWEYFCGVLLRACREFERLAATRSVPRGAKGNMVADAVGRLPQDFRYVDLERLLPSVSRPTINRALRRLRAAQTVRCVRPGRNARWRREVPG